MDARGVVMRRRFLQWLAVAAMGVSAPAFAQGGFSYTYVDVGYLHTEFDDDDIDADGAALEGSYEFSDRFHGFAAVAGRELDLDAGAFDLELDARSYELGAGLNWPLNPNLDIVGTVSYIREELDLPGDDELEDNGIGLGVGLRGRVAQRFELSGGLSYANFGDDDDAAAAAVGVRYFFTNLFALGAAIGFGEDSRTASLSARFNFGT
jgi:hypothetical protein